MDERFFTSPHRIQGYDDDVPVVFLAGPVQGAPDWQSRFAKQLLDERADIVVASPRRRPEVQRKFDTEEQVAWEIHHRARAREFGATVFWFAARDLSDTTYPEGRAYAQTTRIEIGETIGWRRAIRNLSMVVGFDPAYGENGGGSEGYIRKLMRYYDIPVYDSEDDTIAATLDKI